MNAIKALGLFIQIEKWDKQNKLPLYITNNFLIQKAIINGFQCLALTPKNELPTLPALKKQINKIQNVEPLPIFLKIDTLSIYRKESLIANGIPFILLDKMVYLPFLSTLLTNTQFYPNISNNKLTISTQVLFIWILYQSTDSFYISDAVEKLHFSNMTMTRAYRQLVSTGLFEEYKEGRRIYLTSDYSKKELFKIMQPYLKSPITNFGYIEKIVLNDEMIESGETALSRYSFLSPPYIPTFAIHKDKAKHISIQNELIDINEQVKIEVWNYDPFLFAKKGQPIDPLSLVISLLGNEDERVEMERDHLLDSLFYK